MARLRRIAHTHRLALMKTATYYVMHITVAMAVAYAVTGNWLAALTLSLLEPTVQAVAYFFHERAWARVQQRPAAATSAAPQQPTSRVEGNGALGRELIAEMDNPPVIMGDERVER